MSDESGGDFGGGSVKWEMRYKDNSATHNQNVPPHGGGSIPVAGKKRSSGSENTTETNFYLVLKNSEMMPSLRQRLLDAANSLGTTTPTPNEVVIEIPIQQNSQKQIRVLWERPH
jgi:hypothetical protein